MKIKYEEWPIIIQKYSIGLQSTGMLAKAYGVSRRAIWMGLNNRGIDTSKVIACWRTRNCAFCGAEVSVRRARMRDSTSSYCNQECYIGIIKLRSPNYKAHRQGQRKAREVVSKHFTLLPGYIVHHEDGNNDNNAVSNLTVFASNVDHMGYHRMSKKTAPALWMGASIT